MSLLEVNRLGINFGGLRAVNDISFRLDKGEIVGLIGPNGAGKTTVFNLLTGVYTPTDGTIELDGKNMIGLPTYEIVEQGMARTFQNIRLFKNISVLDNIRVGFQDQGKYTVGSAILRLPSYWKEEAEIERKSYDILDIFGMRKLAGHLAGNLPYGMQRKLEICRALATKPKILLLDEPAAGMNPTETSELMETIHLIRDRFDIAILLIEHDMHLVMGICERLLVLDYGCEIAAGLPDEIAHNAKVIEAYLGADDEDLSELECNGADLIEEVEADA